MKKLIAAAGADNYNILQNNGRIAHQEVDHVSLLLLSSHKLPTRTPRLTAEHQVHFHMIPKPDAEQGLGVRWPQQKTDMDALKSLCEDIKAKM